MNFLRSFLFLWLFTVLGIILHELGHHLFGIPSVVSLARNWPLVPVTEENKYRHILGTLAGPTVNLALGFAGLCVHAFSEKRPTFKDLGLFCGIANSFLVLSSAVINLVVDLALGTRGNDLQEVSQLVGMNVLIQPAAYALPSTWLLAFFWSKLKSIANTARAAIVLIAGAWLLGGVSLMLLDRLLRVRFRIL